MNHKEEDDSSEFEEASDKELIKQDLQKTELKENDRKKEEEDVFETQIEKQIKLLNGDETISEENLVKENGTLTNTKSNEKVFAEEKKECRFSENFKEIEKGFSYEKLNLNKIKNNNSVIEKMIEDLSIEELKLKTGLKERRGKILEQSIKIKDSKGVQEKIELDTKCDRTSVSQGFPLKKPIKIFLLPRQQTTQTRVNDIRQTWSNPNQTENEQNEKQKANKIRRKKNNPFLCVASVKRLNLSLDIFILPIMSALLFLVNLFMTEPLQILRMFQRKQVKELFLHIIFLKKLLFI
ncbi:hypothetical protein Anas_04657, partial [Armadillidium nasatum]